MSHETLIYIKEILTIDIKEYNKIIKTQNTTKTQACIKTGQMHYWNEIKYLTATKQSKKVSINTEVIISVRYKASHVIFHIISSGINATLLFSFLLFQTQHFKLTHRTISATLI